MKYFYFVCFFLIFCEIGYCQRVYPKTAIIRLEKFSSLNNDGILTFEIDVRMADCLSNIEMNDMKKKKKRKMLGINSTTGGGLKSERSMILKYQKPLQKKYMIMNTF